jgi:hypothetical protein
MKKLLVLGVLIAIASGVYADPEKTNYTAPVGPKNQKALHPPPVTNRSEVDGVVPRAFQRGGNPLQMLNPNAPARYGTAAQAVAIDPDTGKLNGIKLFEIIF